MADGVVTTDLYAQLTPAEGTTVQLPATGLASLDIELPRRGREYLFTTPRGAIEIKARAIAAPHVERLSRLLVILAVFAGVAAVYQVFRYLNRVLGRRLKASLLTVLGLASLVTFVVPIAGLVSLVTGIVLFFRR